MEYLGNAFSLNMLADKNATLEIEELAVDDFSSRTQHVHSVVGHADTAAVLSGVLGFEVESRRESVTLKKGDVLYVAQYSGPRLEEGTTTLPEGASFCYLTVVVKNT